MEHVLLVSVTLFLGFNLGVLVVRLLDPSDPNYSPEGLRADVHTASAWWR